jgi:carbon monoxide dehydrogenase subunit G
MIRIERTVTVDRPVDEVAKYLSDFRTTSQWDPHTASCEREDTGPLGVGSRFVNKQKFGPVRSSYTYEVSEYEPGRGITLRSTSTIANLTDSMQFSGNEQRTTVTYVAQFEFKGIARSAEPVLKPLIDKIADDGARGMEAALRRLPAGDDAHGDVPPSRS